MPAYYGFAYDKHCLDYLKTLDKKCRRQIVTKIQQLAANPHPATAKVVQGMVDGSERVYRIRSGDYRILDSFHRRARPEERVFMTAYQVLSLINEVAREQLFRDAGPAGRGAGSYHSAAKAIAKMLVEMDQAGEVETAVLDVRLLTLDLEGQGKIEPGSQYGCGIYRLRGE